MPSVPTSTFHVRGEPSSGLSDELFGLAQADGDDTVPNGAGRPAFPSQLLPRLIRLKDAPRYLGIDKNIFNRDVRPKITEIRHGSSSV